jgi:hypothetical protein
MESKKGFCNDAFDVVFPSTVVFLDWEVVRIGVFG